MTKHEKNEYLPDYAVKPGEILQDYLDERQMNQTDLSVRTGLSKKTINEIIQGKSPITPESAFKLELVLGRPAHFWNNLECQYQENRIRVKELERRKNRLDWLAKFPVKPMIKLGWIENSGDKLYQLDQILRFFGVASPEQWNTVWSERPAIAFRRNSKFEPFKESIAAWLRKGELEAEKKTCDPYDQKLFQKNLIEIRKLTQEPQPDKFCKPLLDVCRACGVIVLFTPELPKMQVCGATRWLGTKAIIQLSLRYKSNDQLWFTFFHEAGHILKHGKKEIFLEGVEHSDEKEEEANRFAREILIPSNEYQTFCRGWNRRSLDDIIQFSRKIDIAPGILVGRLQHDHLLAITHGNKLKIFYRWADGC